MLLIADAAALFLLALAAADPLQPPPPPLTRGSNGGRHRRPSPPVPLISVSINVDSKAYLPRLLRSIDHPVGRVVVQVGNSDPAVIADVRAKVANASVSLPHLNVTLASVLAGNPGSANGFNFGLRNLVAGSTAKDGWVLVVNGDIAFYPGVLARIARNVDRHLTRDPLFGIGFTSLCCGSEWSAVVFTRRVVDRVGYLDENFYPAYYEDDDYAIRVYLSGLKAARFNNTALLHGKIDGSKDYESGVALNLYFATNKADAAVVTWRRLFEAGVVHSEGYMRRKWGIDAGKKKAPTGAKKVDCKSVAGMNGACVVPYRHPFNDSRKPLSWWQLEQDGRDAILRKAGVVT